MHRLINISSLKSVGNKWEILIDGAFVLKNSSITQHIELLQLSDLCDSLREVKEYGKNN